MLPTYASTLRGAGFRAPSFHERAHRFDPHSSLTAAVDAIRRGLIVDRSVNRDGDDH